MNYKLGRVTIVWLQLLLLQLLLLLPKEELALASALELEPEQQSRPDLSRFGDASGCCVSTIWLCVRNAPHPNLSFTPTSSSWLWFL